MQRVSVALVAGLVLCSFASPSSALGFGRYGNSSLLGQTLDFAATLNLNEGESVAPECIAAEVLAGENALAPGSVRVRLDRSGSADGPTVRVTTTVHIDEPVVTINLRVGCQAQLSRQFVAFVDPPLFVQAQPQAHGESAPAQDVPAIAVPHEIAPAAPVTADAAPSRPAAPPAARRPLRSASASAPSVARSRADAARSPASRPRSVARAASATSGPRLMLEPPMLAAAEPLAASAASAASNPGPDVAAAPDSSASDRERLRALEQNLEAVRKENAETQRTVAALQARLREAEAARQANPSWMHGLLAAIVLLLLLIAALVWRQSRLRRDAAWWGGEAVGQGTAAASPLSAAPAPAAAPVEPTAAQMRIVSAPGEDEAEATVVLPPSPPVVVASAPAPAPAPYEFAAEELIDLEQQADFFIVLGQEEAAIDLLMGHVRSTGGASPLPYLKLLDIYRQRGEREAYERIRERFNRRFNAYAPDLESDAGSDLTLERYPEAVLLIQEAWPQPAQAMAVLEGLLFRRESDSTFALSAYGELLFLYAMARDLAERTTGFGGIDLLLPLGEVPPTTLRAASSTVDVELDFDVEPRRAF